MLNKIIEFFEMRVRFIQTKNELSRLSDHTLRDIGINRDEIDDISMRFSK